MANTVVTEGQQPQPEQKGSEIDRILAGTFSQDIPPFYVYGKNIYFPSDAGNLVNFSALNKDPRLLVVDVAMDQLNYKSPGQVIVDVLARNSSEEPNIFQKDLAYAMRLGQIQRQIEEIQTVRLAFYQQQIEEAEGEKRLLETDKNYHEALPRSPNPPDFKALDQAITDTKNELAELIAEGKAIEEERKKTIDDFKAAFLHAQSMLEQPFASLPPEKKTQFRHNLADLLTEQQKIDAARKTQEKGGDSGITEERAVMLDISLRWKAEEAVKKIKSDITLTQEESATLEMAREHGWLTKDKEGTEKMIHPITSDEKLKLDAFTQQGQAKSISTTEEKAQYEQLKAIRILKAAGQYPASLTDKITLSALMSVAVKNGLSPLPKEEKAAPKRPPSEKNAQELTAQMEQILGSHLSSAAKELSTKEKELADKQKRLSAKMLQLQHKLETAVAGIDATVKNAAIPEYTSTVKSLRAQEDAQRKNTEAMKAAPTLE